MEEKQEYLLLKAELETRLTQAYNDGRLVMVFDALSQTQWPHSIVAAYEYLCDSRFSDNHRIQVLVNEYKSRFNTINNNRPTWNAGSLLWDIMGMQYGVNMLSQILLQLLGHEWKAEWNEDYPEIVY